MFACSATYIDAFAIRSNISHHLRLETNVRENSATQRSRRTDVIDGPRHIQNTFSGEVLWRFRD